MPDDTTTARGRRRRRRWIRKPNSNGWWFYRESKSDRPERVLLSGDGDIVADDDEWERAMGRPPNETLCENYWEGTDTTQDQMPGLWKECP